MDDCTCGCGTPWCARADVLFDVPGMHVLSVQRESTRFVLTVESDGDVGGCPRCGVVAVGHGRRVHQVADVPGFGVPTLVRWRKRIWRCPELACEMGTFSERHELAAPRAKLTRRAIRWATDALAHDDTTVSAIARHLGVDCTRAGTRSRSKPADGSPTPPDWRVSTSSGSMNTSGGRHGSATRTGR